MTVDVHPTLAEYTSREARYRLVGLCLDKINEDKGRGDAVATKVLATHLYVSQRTVQRWASGGIQSCNVNADKLIELAYRLAPEPTDEALREDLERHRITYLNGQPPVRLNFIPAPATPTQEAEA